MSGNLNIENNGDGTLSVTAEGNNHSATIEVDANGIAKISGDIGIFGISYDPATGKYTEQVNVPIRGGLATLHFGNKGTIDANNNIVYDSMFIGLSGKVIGGTEYSSELTVSTGIDEDGNRAFKFSGEASISFLGGLIEFKGELEDFYWDPADMFDPEEDGFVSSGLAGNAFSALKNRQAQIDAAINGTDAGSQISVATNQHFNEANAFVERRDPLSLDLDGDGIETVGANAGITFDFDGDGLKTGTGWVKGDDGFLVLDRNGNGQIDNGGELFGVDTVKANGQKASNGFDALKDFDSNGDGVFDAQDTQFANVKIWQDANQDGIAQAGELKTLAEHNIVAINLDSTASNHNSNGNLISAVGSFVRGDGSEGTVNANQSLAANLDLASNPFYREFTDPIALDDTAKALPDMKGSGAVRDLREASMLNAELKTLLATYSQAQTREEQMGLLDQLIAEWAKSADYQTFDERIDALDNGTTDVRFQYSWEASGAAPTDAQKSTQQLLERIKALEVFNGQNFLRFGKVGATASSVTLSFGMGTTNGTTTYAIKDGSLVINEDRLGLNAGQAGLLNHAYEALKKSIYDGLLLQTRLKPYVDKIGLKITETGVGFDYSEMTELFEQVAAKHPLQAFSDVVDLSYLWKGDASNHLIIGQIAVNLFGKLSANERQKAYKQIEESGYRIFFGDQLGNTLTGTALDDRIYGGDGNDVLYGGAGNDLLSGGDGNDALYGSIGSDTLDGGAGNDTLFGEGGDDTFLFGKGDGQDVIESIIESRPNRVNTLAFKAGVQPTEIALLRSDDHLVIKLIGTQDQITVRSFFRNDDPYSPYNPLQRFTFSDGTSWDIEAIRAHLYGATSGNDSLAGTAYADNLQGLAGNDTLDGRDGNDTLDGGDGNDVLYGGAGNDLLSGGDGNDALYGSIGSDTLDGGAGNDTLFGEGGDDTFLFGKGDGQDVIESIIESRPNRVNTLAFKAGVQPTEIALLRSDDHLVIKLIGTQDQITVRSFFRNDDPYSPYNPLQRFTFSDGTSWDIEAIRAHLYGATSGNDSLAGTAYADNLQGLAGNDTLDGRDGNDTLDGGDGNDVLYGGAGNDLLSGGDGNDALYGSIGSDTLDGGAGNDTLFGEGGDDTFLFGKGDGQDVIESIIESRPNRVNTLAFKAGVQPTEIALLRSDDHLVIKLIGTQDQITVRSFFRNDDPYSPYNPLQRFTFSDGTSWDIEAIRAHLYGATSGNDSLAGTAYADNLQGLAGNDTLDGRDGNDTLDGGDGNDVLYGGAGNDLLSGGDGNDALYGSIGSDTLDGGAGNDTLFGEGGDDTFLFGKGDGQDVIESIIESRPNRVNTLAFKAGVQPTEIALLRSDDHLVIKLIGTQDQITVRSFFRNDDPYSPYNPLQRFTFSDGTSWDIEAIRAHLYGATSGNDSLAGTAYADNLQGLAGNDTLDGRDGNDTLDGGDGNDVLYGGAGNDLLSGGDGNDALYGSIGSDTLDGGAGNDTLFGEGGDDTFLFGKGDGQDVIESIIESRPNRVNTLAFKAGVQPTEIALLRSDDHLVIKLIGTQDQITVRSFFRNDDPYSPYNPLQRFTFSDGTSWDIEAIRAHLYGATSGNDSLAGTAYADNLQGLAGNDTLDGRDGNDTLDGGDGNDVLYGGAGNDLLSGGDGNDALYGSIGSDTLDGGAGNDTLFGEGGDDTFLFGKGDGQDVIESIIESRPNRVNTLAFKAGVQPTEIALLRSDDHLVIKLIGTQDQITVRSFFRNDDPYSPYNPLQRFTFSDGTSWDIEAIRAHLYGATSGNDSFAGTAYADNLQGLAGNDTLDGRDGNDTLDGGDGNDVLYGGAGNDLLSGGDGNDALYGSIGSDTLDGGAGNDTLFGEGGDDTFLFAKGNGQDLIVETDGNDTLLFGQDISANDIWLQRNGSNLELTLRDSADKVTINNWYSSTSNHIETIKSGDGKTLLDSQVQNLVNAMAAFAPPAGGSSNLTPEQKAQLEVVIAANWA
ncbi:calcium-binding protein [Pseudomonas solani]|uniref:calcium-binding protein n=1 Tax=Pseudomonas solani TaxID=2731552 RepID=UPI0035BE5957